MKHGRWVFFSYAFFLCLPLAGQTCPAPNFRTASQANIGYAWSLIRIPSGSFTLLTGDYSLSPLSVSLGSMTSGFQRVLLACSGHTPATVTPPPNWSFGSASLLGIMSHDPEAAVLGSTGLILGAYATAAWSNPDLLQTFVITTSGTNMKLPTYTVTQQSDGIIMADLNNDGIPDLVVKDPGLGGLFVFLTNPDGSLTSPTTPLSGLNANDIYATAADLNGDGNVDLVVTCLYGTCGNTITILLGNGNGTFGVPVSINAGIDVGTAAVADVNGDGKLDLVTTTVNVGTDQNGIAIFFGNGDGTFQTPHVYPTVGSLDAIAVADVNHDGWPDVVASDFNGAALILLNAGNGTFPTATGYVTGSFGDTFESFLMDFDWDGNPDIVFASGHPDILLPVPYSQNLTVLFGNGDGTFNGIPAYPLPAQAPALPSGLAIADFNGDGKPDAVAGTQTGISVLLGHGDGTFTPQVVSPQQGSTSLAAGAFRPAGNADFIATNPTSGISVYLGNGNGTFQQPASTTTSGAVTGAAVGDFNADGRLDFAVVDSGAGPGSNVYIYLGNGNGTFQSPKNFTVGSNPKYVQVADVNGDGKLDLVVTNNGTVGSATDVGSVAVLLGNGDGTFQQEVQYTAGGNPDFTLVTDINGDGKPDMVTSNSNGLSVRLNQGSGAFGAAQTISLGNGPYTEIGAADFNGDGKVDLLVGACCGLSSMGYLLGNGDGTFQPEVTVVNGNGQINARVADLNGDGKPDAMFTMGGPYAAAMTNITASTTAITIQTNPSGLQFSVDGGAAQTAPQTLNLTQGPHTLAVTSPQAGSTGTQYVFASWSDGTKAASDPITVGNSAANYTATFTTQYQLTISAFPVAGGTVTPASGGFYNAGAAVPVLATPNGGYTFDGWTGSVASASSASTTVTMGAPESVTANFTGTSGSCSLALSPPSVQLPATGTSTAETCPNNSGQPNCGVTPEIPSSFTVSPSAACGSWTATSSNLEFLQITSGTSGSGNGTVTYVLLNNTHALPQNYTITVASGSASQPFAITEAGSGDSQVYREVYALYEQLLGRDPDPSGFAFWTGSGGAELGQMADSFLTSPEAFNSDFAVMAAYQAATGAPPTFAQYTAGVASIRANTQTVGGLFTVLAGSSFTAANLYQNLLSRAPGSADASCYATSLSQCFETIIGYPGNITPMSTPNNEFQSTGTFHTDHTNALYVQMIYYVTLSRDPDPSGLAFWIGVANSAGPGLLFQGAAGYPTRIQILGPGTPNQGFIGSPEFQGLFAN